MISNEDLLKRAGKAEERRRNWEGHWRDCYDYALPNRQGFDDPTPGAKRTDKLFDGTAPDAVDQLASSLLSQLTPPWRRWFGLTGGTALDPEEHGDVIAEIERIAEVAQTHFDMSNLVVEISQCYLDLVTAGTASLWFEPSADGGKSRFSFSAIPPWQVSYEEGAAGALDTTFRRWRWSLDQIKERFPAARVPDEWTSAAADDASARFGVLEAVIPDSKGRYDYRAVGTGRGDVRGISTAAAPSDTHELASSVRDQSPFINFRWSKVAGEIYGRSPVMKVLPDIKTANLVVELVLKNASIAVTGMWQADDDGVINPATIRLVPGAIIPKAVGSAGLQPLQAPGRFDVSQLILESIHKRIRHALMIDRLAEIDASARMTATEVLERTAEMARLLGATYGRLQVELLDPMIDRGLRILAQAGEIEPIVVDGAIVKLQYRSPLVSGQQLDDARNVDIWTRGLAALGPRFDRWVNDQSYAAETARMIGVPTQLVRNGEDVDRAEQEAATNAAAQMATQALIAGGGGSGGAGGGQ